MPLLYRRSGCLPEYCDGFGIPFDGTGDVLDAIGRMIDGYEGHAARMGAYPHTATRMAGEWLALLERLVASREEIAAHKMFGRAGGESGGIVWGRSHRDVGIGKEKGPHGEPCGPNSRSEADQNFWLIPTK